jgi:hypothetical protein
MSDQEFKRMFRLTRTTFNFLLEKIRPFIEAKPNLKFGSWKNPKSISPEIKLAATLRWLAGGSYLDICFAFGLSAKGGFFYKANGPLWPTMEAIEKVLVIGFPLNDESKLEEISNGFAKFSKDRVKGCVMAVDGWVCRTRCPTKF